MRWPMRRRRGTEEEADEMVDTTRIDAAQLAAHLQHSPANVARAAAELARCRSDDWNQFLEAFCTANCLGREQAVSQLQFLIYQYCDKRR